MSKRELGKLASVVDVDAPRAKRRKEAPQDEKKPNADMDVDVTGGTTVKREEEDSAKLEQVKEQGSKLWQTVKDAVDKECVTDPCALCFCSPAYSLISSTTISPAAAPFQSIFFVSPTNAPTRTITPSLRSPSLLTRSRRSSTPVNTHPSLQSRTTSNNASATPSGTTSKTARFSTMLNSYTYVSLFVRIPLYHDMTPPFIETNLQRVRQHDRRH